MLNICALQGRLARDPELRQTNTGKQVATFTLAVDRGRRDTNGQSVADWIPVIAWEKAAEFAYKWLHKGQMVAVDGRLQSRTYLKVLEGETVEKTAFEISVVDLERISDTT